MDHIPDDDARSTSPGRSSIHLPRIDPPPATILDYLAERFPHVSRGEWRDRMDRGRVMGRDGEPIRHDAPYRAETTIRYFREVPDERTIPFEEEIIFRNGHLLIADKPHFLPVVPTGPYVNECLVNRLRRRTGLEHITPVHRLDRETAGLVLFALDPATRPLYHRLFAERRIEKEYLAIGAGEGELRERFTIANRLAPGEPWFRMRIVDGEPNAVTHVEVLRREDGRALMRLRPESGRKHQLRVHLLSIGYPIVNDGLYPEVLPHAPYDFSSPMQLLASSLAFIDPVSGVPMRFTTPRAEARGHSEGGAVY